MCLTTVFFWQMVVTATLREVLFLAPISESYKMCVLQFWILKGNISEFETYERLSLMCLFSEFWILWSPFFLVHIVDLKNPIKNPRANKYIPTIAGFLLFASYHLYLIWSSYSHYLMMRSGARMSVVSHLGFFEWACFLIKAHRNYYLTIYLTTYLCIHLSIYLSILLSIYLSMYPFFHLSI